ncbi:MAG TPA: phosphomannomutase/phosphoglucomutase [Candidatus Nanoarchaeia archaeon]|nr:phosphomannomutase/phosphoglucomutase [Candidatus Nanoarchaeia archaeon]
MDRSSSTSKSSRKPNTGIFRAYDIRGVYPSEICTDDAYLIGKALVAFAKAKTVLVGRDARLSSPALHEAFVRGVTASGADVLDIGLASTDMFYFASSKYPCDVGAMITASHNPKQYNGMKFVRKNAIPILDKEIQELRKIIEGFAPSKTKRIQSIQKKGNIRERKGILKEFIDFTLSIEPLKTIKKLKVVMDTANGMGGMIVPELFKKSQLDIVPMCWEVDGRFPDHEPNPLIAKNRKKWIAKVKEEKADLGIAWDGDTDRVFFCDEKGRFVQGDVITGLLAEMSLKKFPRSAIVYDLRASWFVKDTILRNGGKPVMNRVGHSFIKARMRKEKAKFAGEVTGHYYYDLGNYYAEDSYLAAIQILKLMSSTGKKLSELLAPFFNNYFVTGELNFKNIDKARLFAKIKKAYHDARILELDGITIEYKDWWFNLRASNTEPLVRLNLEAKSQAKMVSKKKEVSAIIGGMV